MEKRRELTQTRRMKMGKKRLKTKRTGERRWGIRD